MVLHEPEGAPRTAALLAGELEDTGAGGGWSWDLSDLNALVALGATVAIPATAEAATWRTITQSNDRSPYMTLAQISRTSVNATSSLRVLVRAPKGRTETDGSVFCWDPQTYESASRDFAWSYRSRGRRQAWRHSVPTLGFPRCDVYLSTWGKGGWLTLKLQRFA